MSARFPETGGGGGGGGAVDSVNGQTGVVVLDADDVGAPSDAEFSAEQTARANADTALQSAINAEASTRSSADSTLTTAIGDEETARETADTTLTNAIAAEESARIAADALKQATSEKGQANGYASLDSGGKVPANQLPSSLMEYLGVWNASTNSPTLADGTGAAGNVYRVTTAGSQNLGSGSITFDVGDYVIHNGTAWEKSDTTDSVASVAGKTGVVTLDTSDISGLSAALSGKQDSSAILTSLVNNGTPSSLGLSLLVAANSGAARTLLSLGTAAVLDVPTSGDATSGQVVKGNDSRLSDTRTPTDASVTAAKVAGSLKPSGTAATTDEALRALGTGAGAAQSGAVILANGLGVVNHGSTASTARPSGFAAILWVGSVEPSNAVNGDVWINTA